MKKVLMWIGSVLVLLIAVAYLLPSQVTVARSKKIDAPASQIQPLVTSVHNWQRWSPWNKRDPEMKIIYGPVTEGQGASWRWESKSEGNGKMTITEVRPDTVGMALVFMEDGEDSPAMSGFSFRPDGSGTLVTWTMSIDCGMNPIWRYMGLMFESMIGEDYEKGLGNLKALAEKGTASVQ